MRDRNRTPPSEDPSEAKQVVGDKAMAPKHPPVVLPHALHIPGINKLAGKRVILASASPRRKEILQIFVRSWPVG